MIIPQTDDGTRPGSQYLNQSRKVVNLTLNKRCN